MTLSLIAPVGTNFIKDWPAQNEVNCNAIDDFAGANCLRTHPLGIYTPVLTAVTTPPTLGGAGSIVGYYYKIFDQIYTWGYFRFATGFTAGNGVYSVTLPFKVKSAIAPSTSLGGGPMLGNGFVWDDSAGATRQPVSVALRTNQSIMFGLRFNSGAGTREVTHTAPITWAVDDGIKWFARYQRDTT